MPGASPYSRYGVDVNRLSAAWRHSREVLRPFREFRSHIIRQLVGARYSEDGAERDVPVNLLLQASTILGRLLIPNQPRGLFQVDDPKLWPTVEAIETYVNDEIERQQIDDEMGMVVMDAIISVGVAYVALSTPAESEKRGWNQKTGRPFYKRISLDDWAFDPYARDVRELCWQGDRLRLPLDSIRDNPEYSKARKDVKPVEDDRVNHEGDEKAAIISRGTRGEWDTEYKPSAEIWRFFFPDKKKVCWFTDEQIQGGGSPYDDEPLLEKEWIGPDRGPYHTLWMFPIPDNLMGVSPCMNLVPTHEMVNEVFIKLMEQATRQKTILVASHAAAEDAQRVQDAKDGEIVLVGNPEMIRQVVFGGPDPNNQQFFEASRSLFSWLAGNLDILAGLQSQAKTLGQEKLLNQNSSRSIVHMEGRVNRHLSDSLEALGWYYHHHPTLAMETVKKLDYSPNPIMRTVHPATANVDPRENHIRNFPYDKMRVKVNPYSLPYSTPAEKSQALQAIIMNVLTPMMGPLREAGYQFDVAQFTEIIAKYDDMPELRRLFQMAPPPEPEGGRPQGEAHDKTMAPNTSRTNVRVNASEQTPGGQQSNMRQALLGYNAGGASQNGAANGQAGIY